jgi:hypothetical protein
MPMTAHQRMAALSDFLPEAGSPRRGWRAWVPRLSCRRPRGLAAIPERYRLQFLLLADAQMPGRAEADVAAMADALADRSRPPKRLLAQLPETTGLDRWFKDRTDQIKATLADLLEAEA